MVKLLVDAGFYVDVILTHAAVHFLGVDYKGAVPGIALRELACRVDVDMTPLVSVWVDEDEWSG